MQSQNQAISAPGTAILRPGVTRTAAEDGLHDRRSPRSRTGTRAVRSGGSDKLRRGLDTRVERWSGLSRQGDSRLQPSTGELHWLGSIAVSLATVVAPEKLTLGPAEDMTRQFLDVL
jgi:hypothetical protein